MPPEQSRGIQADCYVETCIISACGLSVLWINRGLEFPGLSIQYLSQEPEFFRACLHERFFHLYWYYYSGIVKLLYWYKSSRGRSWSRIRVLFLVQLQLIAKRQKLTGKKLYCTRMSTCRIIPVQLQHFTFRPYSLSKHQSCQKKCMPECLPCLFKQSYICCFYIVLSSGDRLLVAYCSAHEPKISYYGEFKYK